MSGFLVDGEVAALVVDIGSGSFLLLLMVMCKCCVPFHCGRPMTFGIMGGFWFDTCSHSLCASGSHLCLLRLLSMVYLDVLGDDGCCGLFVFGLWVPTTTLYRGRPGCSTLSAIRRHLWFWSEATPVSVCVWLPLLELLCPTGPRRAVHPGSQVPVYCPQHLRFCTFLACQAVFCSWCRLRVVTR